MSLTIKAKNLVLTAQNRTYITEKFEAIEVFLKPEDKIRVELEVDKKHNSGLTFRAEADIQPKGNFAEARGNDLYEALDLLLPKIKEQLKKAKDKRVSLRRRGDKTR